MNNLRITEKNKVLNDIKTKESTFKRNDETISRLRSQEYSKFNETQIDKLRNQNFDIKNDIKSLNERLKDIELGNIDIELRETSNKAINDIKKKNDIKIKKTQEQTEYDKKGKDTLTQYYKNNNEYSQASMLREYERWCNIVPPQYMQDNLKEMPANKGYIWKGRKFYGEKKAVSKDEIMFEKKRGENLHIIETVTRGYYRYETIYEKIGNEKRLVSKKEIPRETFGFEVDKNHNLMVLDKDGNLMKSK
jgi:hypothetical protein